MTLNTRGWTTVLQTIGEFPRFRREKVIRQPGKDGEMEPRETLKRPAHSTGKTLGRALFVQAEERSLVRRASVTSFPAERPSRTDSCASPERRRQNS
jgi:hypothetical protein